MSTIPYYSIVTGGYAGCIVLKMTKKKIINNLFLIDDLIFFHILIK